jgi:predicted TPR repeat methyltransferase
LTDGQTIGEVLREAMIAHRAGRLAEAETGYHRVLQERPTEPRALHFLGLLQFHRGDLEGGIERVLHSLKSDPGNARAWNALGGMLIAVGRTVEARDAYRRATEVSPESAEGWYNLGICLRNENDFESAIHALREALARDPSYSRAHEALGMLFYQLGRSQEAAKVYADWSAREPSNSKASHMAAAMSGKNAPARASDEYVRKLFDESAQTFDSNLEQLDYRAPQAVAQALTARADGKFPTVLDGGCGTGLCGPLIRALCWHLVGVDISEKMIERAQARECYDELVTSELTAFLHWRVRAFDAVVSADTLVYFGTLDELFAAANESLRERGLLIFTLEALDPAAGQDYRLQEHGRYAHNEAYVRNALIAANFTVEALNFEAFRKERDQDVPGFLVVARRN